MRKSPAKSAIILTLVYIGMASAWAILAHVSLNVLVIGPQSYFPYDLPLDLVDIALVGGTAALLFLLLRHEFTVRERANQALRKSRDELELRVRQRTQELDAERMRLLRIMDTMPDGICIINESFDLEYANPALEKQWGPAYGRKCHEYFNDQDQACLWCSNARARAGATVHQEWFSSTAQRTYDMVSTPIDDPDGKTLTLQVFHDITERRSAEREQARLLQQIDAERRLFQTVIDSAPVSIALFDSAELRVQWANRRYQQSLLPLPGETGGGELGRVDIFPSAANSDMLDILRQVAATGQPYFEPELESLDPTRGLTYWQWSLLPLAGADTGHRDLMLLANDITELVSARKRMEELNEEAGKVAALEERQRLARELHDSVSQALYGIALGTHAARQQIERAPHLVSDTLNYVLSLAETAETEMRALVFELHPDSLEQEGLVAALSRHAEAMQARDELDVRLELGAEPALSLATKEVVYRVAQEALRNTAKHAHARSVDLRFCAEGEWFILEVIDDGIGFDPNDHFPGHLGLQSMRERVVRLGGRFTIDSHPASGTYVRARLPFGPVGDSGLKEQVRPQ